MVFSLLISSKSQAFEVTRCIETQKAVTLSNNGLNYLIQCSVVPENPMGSAIFKIDSKWKIESSSNSKGKAYINQIIHRMV